MTDYREILANRAKANTNKMDAALWERDASRGGVNFANDKAREAWEKVREVRLEASYREEIKCRDENAINAEYGMRL